MNANYEIVHVDVLETDKKSLENPGGEAMMNTYGGKDQGLPFFAVLKPDGVKLGDSDKPAKGKSGVLNMGYPAETDEIDAFMTLLHKTGKHLKGDDETAVKAYLVAHAKR